MLPLSFYSEKERNREEEEKVRGERLTGGPRVKKCCVEVELPEGEVVGGLGCGSAGPHRCCATGLLLLLLSLLKHK